MRLEGATGLTEDCVEPLSSDADEQCQAAMEGARRAIQASTVQRQAKSARKQELAYNKRHRVESSSLKAGDRVMRTDKQISRRAAAGRLRPLYHGPFKVVAVWKTGVDLQHEETGEEAKKVKFHLLKLIVERQNAERRQK